MDSITYRYPRTLREAFGDNAKLYQPTTQEKIMELFKPVRPAKVGKSYPRFAQEAAAPVVTSKSRMRKSLAKWLAIAIALSAAAAYRVGVFA